MATSAWTCTTERRGGRVAVRRAATARASLPSAVLTASRGGAIVGCSGRRELSDEASCLCRHRGLATCGCHLGPRGGRGEKDIGSRGLPDALESHGEEEPKGLGLEDEGLRLRNGGGESRQVPGREAVPDEESGGELCPHAVVYVATVLSAPAHRGGLLTRRLCDVR